MYRSKIAGMGYYVPERIVTNDELSEVMDTTDAWIQERTGIRERRYGKKHLETTTSMGAAAARIACERAGISPEEIDFIVFATLSPDYYFPGCGVLLQRELGITKSEAGALDIRNQCSGFIYALSIADQFVKTGMYKNVLIVGAEMHSMGLDFSTRGRNVTVIFGDGAGAAIIQPTTDDSKGILSTKLHSDGTYAEKLAFAGGENVVEGRSRGVHGVHDDWLDVRNHPGLAYQNAPTPQGRCQVIQIGVLSASGEDLVADDQHTGRDRTVAHGRGSVSAVRFSGHPARAERILTLSGSPPPFGQTGCLERRGTEGRARL